MNPDKVSELVDKIEDLIVESPLTVAEVTGALLMVAINLSMQAGKLLEESSCESDQPAANS